MLVSVNIDNIHPYGLETNKRQASFMPLVKLPIKFSPHILDDKSIEMSVRDYQVYTIYYYCENTPGWVIMGYGNW